MVLKRDELSSRTSHLGSLRESKYTKILSVSIITLMVISGFMVLMVSDGGMSGGETEPKWAYDTGGDIRRVSMSADGKYVAVGSFDDSIYVFDTDSSEPLWTFQAEDDVFSVAMSADGEYIAAGTNSEDRKLYFFQRNNSTPLWNYTTEVDPWGSGWFSGLDISANGEYIAAGHGNDYIYLFSKDNSTPLWKYKCDSNVPNVVISADGEYIAAGSLDGNLRLFGKDSNDPIWSFDTGTRIRTVAISNDGAYIGVGTMGGDLYILKRESSVPLWKYSTEGQMWGVSFSDSGEYIAACAESKEVLFFENDDNVPEWVYMTESTNRAVTISDTGEYILVGSEDNHAYLFRKESNDPIWSYKTNDDVRGVALSSDGLYAAIGSYDTNFYLFQTEKLILSSAKSTYNPKDLVTIKAAFHKQPANVSIQVLDANGTTVEYDMEEVDETGRTEFSFTLEADAPLGEWEVHGANSVDDTTDVITFEVAEKVIPPVLPHIRILEMSVPESVNRSETVNVSLTIESTYKTEQNITIVLQLWDPDVVPLTPVEKIVSILANTTATKMVTFSIDEDEAEGSYKLKGMLFTKAPTDGGFPLAFSATNIKVS